MFKVILPFGVFKQFSKIVELISNFRIHKHFLFDTITKKRKREYSKNCQTHVKIRNQKHFLFDRNTKKQGLKGFNP